MADSLRDKLRSALAGTYEIEEEIGRGGMAIVYRARDVKHDRTVAVKVLRPELAASLGAERFLREISIAAKLHHPHILQLYDSGDADGSLYYVMPFVEGESLRDRLQREGQLSLDDAMQIVREVGGALGHAHSYGVVHRDIKPENVLLVAGHAIVADFGIARAVSEAGGEQLTETGLAVGTPLYMSPEQSAGDKALDARSDVYSLACVFYEMLAGTPPFVGTSAAAIMARHSMDPVPSLRTVRSTVTPGAEAAIMRALAKVPADRWATAHEFVEALEGAESTEQRGGRFGWVPKAGWAAVVILLAGLAAIVGRNVDLPGFGFGADENDLVAVLPFEVVGSDSVAWLGAAIPEFLTLALTGEAGARAVNSRVVLKAWDRARSATSVPAERERRVAQDVGASRIVTGQVIQQPSGVLAQAELIRAESREILAEASARGPAGSEITVAESLGVQLLAASAGEFERLPGLISTSTEAVKAWLAGEQAFRRGDFDESAARFKDAVDADTTFALAAAGLMWSSGWAARPVEGQYNRGRRLAWQHRDRLPRPDSLIFVAESQRNRYPEWIGEQRSFETYERSVQEYPDRWDAWMRYGDYLWHEGGGYHDDGTARAVAAFERAVELDPDGYAEPWIHLAEHYAAIGDLEKLRGVPERRWEPWVRWIAAYLEGDSVMIDSARSAVPEQPTGMIAPRIGWAQHAAIAMDDAERMAAELERRAFDGDEFARDVVGDFLLNRGQPERATPHLEASTPELSRYWWILLGLYWDADTALVMRAVREAEQLVGNATAEELAAGDRGGGNRANRVRCYLEHWRMSQGRTDTVEETVALLREAAEIAEADGRARAGMSRLCASVLEAWQQTLAGDPEAVETIRDVEAELMHGGLHPFYQEPFKLQLADLYQRLGRDEEALRLARLWGGLPGQVIYYRSTRLLAQARLAAALGHREEAVRAYDQYLILRSDPEPVLADEVAQVREELAELVGEGR